MSPKYRTPRFVSAPPVRTPKPIESTTEMMSTRILVVHGSGESRKTLRNCLESQSHEVVAAPDWTDGYELARWRCFDLIVFDGELPTIDGEEMVRRIRDLAHHSDTPALMLTVESCVTMVSGDCDRSVHMRMPAQFDASQLLDNVDSLLGQGTRETRLVA